MCIRDSPSRFLGILQRYFDKPFTLKQVKAAAKQAYAAYDAHMKSIRQKGAELLQLAKWEHKPVIVLAGRPYHIDPEVNHGIDRLICDLGAIVLSEDSVCHDIPKFKTGVLNQWTYHARLYSAAKFVAQCDPKDLNINLVPVSYTHLDVYKRQDLNVGFEIAADQLRSFGFSAIYYPWDPETPVPLPSS